MITVEGLEKSYAGVPALRGISFEIGKGEIVGFLGPNGAGKSTTMRILTTYLAPSAGRARVAGFDVLSDAARVRESVGYLPENVPVYPDMRVSEYLRYRADLKGVARGERKDRVEAVVAQCGLEDVYRKLAGHLSRGYRQRLGLADALIADPPVLILDEPTSGLDPNQIGEIREVIRSLGTERSVLLSSHILPEVEAVCSRVLIIANGELVARGRPEELSADGGQPARIRIVVEGDENPAERFSVVEGVADVSCSRRGDGSWACLVEPAAGEDPRKALAGAAIEGGSLLELSVEHPGLEALFARVTSGRDTGRATGGDDA